LPIREVNPIESSFTVRTITPNDRQTLALGLLELSATNRYLRFHSSKDHFEDHELEYLTTCDGRNHIGLIAETNLEGTTRCKGVGVARFIRDTSDPEWGEIAVVVVDAWQRQGAGQALLSELASRCRTIGVLGWRASVIGDNQPALNLLAKFGTIVEREWDSHCVSLRIALPSF